MARVIAVANEKGGVTKTTTSVNVAASLAMKGKRVLLIDSDPQGDASASCGVETTGAGQFTLYNVYKGIPAKLAIVETPHKFDVLPSDGALSAMEAMEREKDMSHMLRLKSALGGVRDVYDFIIIDLPPSLGKLTVNGLAAADEVLIPMVPEVLPLQGVQSILSTIKSLTDEDEVYEALNPSLKISGVCLTRFQSRLKLHREVHRQARDLFAEENVRLLKTRIKECVRFGEAPAIGVPAVIADKRTQAVQDYHRLTEEAFGV